MTTAQEAREALRLVRFYPPGKAALATLEAFIESHAAEPALKETAGFPQDSVNPATAEPVACPHTQLSWRSGNGFRCRACGMKLDENAMDPRDANAYKMRGALISLCEEWLARDAATAFGSACGNARTNELVRCINAHSPGQPPVTWYGLSDGFRDSHLHPAPAPGGGWRPIETAPKDGRIVLLSYLNVAGKRRTVRASWESAEAIAEWDEGCDTCSPGWYERSEAHEGVTETIYAVEAPPTHWMPIPPPPEPQP